MTINSFKNSAIFIFCVLIISSGCEQPILEPEQCIASRDRVKKFYSVHFGNDMKPSDENLKIREKYLSNKLKQELKKQSGQKEDYFTQTGDYPKAFRVGGCEAVSSDRAVFDILVFWKTEERSEQRELKVEVVEENSMWFIDKVSGKE